MSDIFEIDPKERDVYLEELFMRADPDTVEVVLHVYDANLRNCMSPESAFQSVVADLEEVPGANIEDSF